MSPFSLPFLPLVLAEIHPPEPPGQGSESTFGYVKPPHLLQEMLKSIASMFFGTKL